MTTGREPSAGQLVAASLNRNRPETQPVAYP